MSRKLVLALAFLAAGSVSNVFAAGEEKKADAPAAAVEAAPAEHAEHKDMKEHKKAGKHKMAKMAAWEKCQKDNETDLAGKTEDEVKAWAKEHSKDLKKKSPCKKLI